MLQSLAFDPPTRREGLFGVKTPGIHELAEVTSVQKARYSLAYHKEWRHIAPPIFLKPTRVRPQAP